MAASHVDLMPQDDPSSSRGSEVLSGWDRPRNIGREAITGLVASTRDRLVERFIGLHTVYQLFDTRISPVHSGSQVYEMGVSRTKNDSQTTTE